MAKTDKDTDPTSAGAMRFINWLGVLTVVLVVARLNPFDMFDPDVVDFPLWIILLTGGLSLFVTWTSMIVVLGMVYLGLIANVKERKNDL